MPNIDLHHHIFIPETETIAAKERERRPQTLGRRPEGLVLGLIEGVRPNAIGNDAAQKAARHRAFEFPRGGLAPVLKRYVADAAEVIMIFIAEGDDAVIRHLGDVFSGRAADPVVEMRWRGGDQRHVDPVGRHGAAGGECGLLFRGGPPRRAEHARRPRAGSLRHGRGSP